MKDKMKNPTKKEVGASHHTTLKQLEDGQHHQPGHGLKPHRKYF